MCTRYLLLERDYRASLEALDATVVEEFLSRYNIAVGSMIPVVRAQPQKAGREAVRNVFAALFEQDASLADGIQSGTTIATSACSGRCRTESPPSSTDFWVGSGTSPRTSSNTTLPTRILLVVLRHKGRVSVHSR